MSAVPPADPPKTTTIGGGDSPKTVDEANPTNVKDNDAQRTSNRSGQRTDGFAPADYSDNRALGDWKSIYGWQAVVGIWLEAIYLLLVLASSLYYTYIIVSKALDADPNFAEIEKNGGTLNKDVVLLSLAAAFAGGVLGGCTFALKWMYHSVAKKLWHADRRLWRVLTPLLCGVVALATTLLISTNLLRIFDPLFLKRPITVLAFSFLVGYFSDKALAKLAEVADTLFGSAKQDLQRKEHKEARQNENGKVNKDKQKDA